MSRIPVAEDFDAIRQGMARLDAQRRGEDASAPAVPRAVQAESHHDETVSYFLDWLLLEEDELGGGTDGVALCCPADPRDAMPATALDENWESTLTHCVNLAEADQPAGARQDDGNAWPWQMEPSGRGMFQDIVMAPAGNGRTHYPAALDAAGSGLTLPAVPMGSEAILRTLAALDIRHDHDAIMRALASLNFDEPQPVAASDIHSCGGLASPPIAEDWSALHAGLERLEAERRAGRESGSEERTER